MSQEIESTEYGIQRHKAAIKRMEMSLPVKCLVRDNLLSSCTSFFDYGCGHGDDIRHVAKLGLDACGWDPVHQPEIEKCQAEAVNLGYVLNVIEDTTEREETLRAAWKLCGRVMTVAARILVGGRGESEIEYGDGVVTQIGTFQKYFTQAELREYLESVLETEALPAAPGIFYLFRDDDLKLQFLSSRYRRRVRVPKKRASERRFEEHKELLEALIDWITEHGRVPDADELEGASAITDEFGSLKRAFALIRRVTGDEPWQEIRKARIDDLLVYLALENFRKRPRFSQQPLTLQRNIRAFYGTYKRACEQADTTLFRAGNADAIDEACKNASLGKLLPKALYIHRSALDELGPLLRIYEGCARAFIGEIESANIIKIHRFSGKISYLVYPDFEKKPHPVLLRSVKINLRQLWINTYDYSTSDNPPILHRKEAFLPTEHELYERFAKLTRQEEKHGLLDDASTIGTRNGWHMRLRERGYCLKGHRLVRQKMSAPI